MGYPSGPGDFRVEPFFVSTGIVALAEIGDKTQLLAFVLAAKFRKPLPIIAGILLATVVNHGLAGSVGVWITSWLDPFILRWLLGIGFIAMAVWVLMPDELEQADARPTPFGVLATTMMAFFLAEMGDKTQVATVALAAQYAALPQVVSGTTLGMLIANVPAVLLGDRCAGRIPVRLVHGVAAALFAVLGAVVLVGASAGSG